MRCGDIGTELIFYLKDQNKAIVNLAGASAAYIIMWLNDAVPGTEKEITISSPQNGAVSYTIQEGDLNEEGYIKFRVRIEYINGHRFTSSEIIEKIYSCD